MKVVISLHFRWLIALLLAYSIVWSGHSRASDTATADRSADGSRSTDVPAGKYVDIGSHRLYLRCIGKGQPTIILEAGLGGFSLEWFTIQNDLATEYHVCSYDRAGYGWSDPGPGPRTVARITDELDALLFLAEEPGPYLFVGHSFGGFIVQYFATQFPGDVAGIILVDSSHYGLTDFFTIAPKLEPVDYRTRRYILSRPVLPVNYPRPVRSQAYDLMNSRKAMYTHFRELSRFDDSARQVAEAGPLPEVPLVVVSRGKRVWPATPEGDQQERVWKILQTRLGSSTTGARQVIAEYSGHYVHLDQPLLVEDAIRNVALEQGCRSDGAYLYAGGLPGTAEC